jgi:hypothetical protein
VEKKIVCKSASLGSLPRTPRLPLTLCLSPAPLPPVPASQAFPFVSICPETDASSPTHQDAAPIAMPPPRLDRRRRPPPLPPTSRKPQAEAAERRTQSRLHRGHSHHQSMASRRPPGHYRRFRKAFDLPIISAAFPPSGYTSVTLSSSNCRSFS